MGPMEESQTALEFESSELPACQFENWQGLKLFWTHKERIKWAKYFSSYPLWMEYPILLYKW
jgi:hypothetical protein